MIDRRRVLTSREIMIEERVIGEYFWKIMIKYNNDMNHNIGKWSRYVPMSRKNCLPTIKLLEFVEVRTDPECELQKLLDDIGTDFHQHQLLSLKVYFLKDFK